MFDFSSIKKRQFDFVIRVNGAPLFDIKVEACKEEGLSVLSELYTRAKNQMFRCKKQDYWSSIVLQAPGVNAQELGERIAIELENSGYTVQRLVPAPLETDNDRSAKVEVQSFLLA